MEKLIYRSIRANAKINLFLKVRKQKLLNKHTSICSLFYPLKNLCDELSVLIIITKKAHNATKVKIKGVAKVLLKNNIIYKVIEKFCKKYNKYFNCEVVVKKKIGIGAGLGGGSSDAFFIFKMLCEVFDIKQTFNETRQFFLKLSQDAVFFFYNCPAIVYQPSNLIIKIKYQLNINFKLFGNNIFSSTKRVFNKYVYNSINYHKYKEIIEIIKQKKQITDHSLWFNDLTPTIEILYPALKKIKKKLNYKYIIYSGTGSAMLAFVK